ncbi:hypothetical protein [Myxococcus landrumensis]|uniref:Lipoprotein n=1 Tax=Myxococcus landrumensis TaxID=2813577 RepID=A0ABX7MWE6_9BACT|nr:hypothetical protein [Myxococcus landrumus]QSQ10757.1 hypothetical protein JY572_20155 [Myxococcus landrumus]
MAVIPAHVGWLSVAAAPVEFTNADAVLVPQSDGTVYRISDLSKRQLDPTAPVLVEVSAPGDTWAPAEAMVDALFGFIILATSPGPSARVRVSASALPITPVALVRAISFSLANDIVELQVMGDGYKRRTVSLRDFSGEMTGLSPLMFGGAIVAGAPLLIEIGKGAGSQVMRAWVQVPELSHKLTPGVLYERTVKFTGYAFSTERGAGIAWGYGML